jgi:hemoglobin/transferrin/lactoferrin receptor protein
VTVEENNSNLACLRLNPPPGCVFGTISIEGSTSAVNLPKAELTGWELESRYQRAVFFTELAYGRIRGESVADGRALMNIPADAVKLHLGWDQPQWRLGLRINHYRRQDRLPAQDINGAALQTTPAYTLLDLYARWQPPALWGRNLTVNIGVDNTTDRQYRSHLSNLNSPGRSLRLAVSYQI